MSTRHNSANDSEYVYDATKFMLRLGTASTAAHDLVMQCKDQWKPIGLRIAAAKRTAVLSPDGTMSAAANATASNGTQQPFTGPGSQNYYHDAGAPNPQSSSAGGKRLLGKVAAASAFMMN